MEETGQKDVILYALSTCIWCRKTKKLLKELGVEFITIDVDLLDGEESEKARSEAKKWNPDGSYPTLVICGEKCIKGFDEARIKENFKK